MYNPAPCKDAGELKSESRSSGLDSAIISVTQPSRIESESKPLPANKPRRRVLPSLRLPNVLQAVKREFHSPHDGISQPHRNSGPAFFETDTTLAQSRLHSLAVVVGVTVAYYAAARVGLLLQLPGTNASAFWPPSGIGFAAILLFGLRACPGIVLGAFLANLVTLPSTPAGCIAAAAISLGNTLEHVLGYAVIRWSIHRSNPFERAQDVFLFVATAALSSGVASSNGVTSLWLLGIIPGTQYDAAWLTWWLGDVAGMLVLTPTIYSWGTKASSSQSPGHRVEFAALFVLTILLAEGLFGDWLRNETVVLPPYLVVPPLLWAAFRFGQRETSLLAVLVSCIAVGHVWWSLSTIPQVHSHFSLVPSPILSVHQSLVALQIFICAVTVTAVTLAAAVSERKNTEAALIDSERRFRTIFEQAAIGVALVETATGRLVRINQCLCGLLGFTQGELTGSTIDSITFNEDSAADARNMHRLITGEIREFTAQKRFQQKNGDLVWVKLTVSPTWQVGSSPEHYIAIAEDITERRRAEEEREKFVALADSSQEFIGMCDLEFRPLYVNAAGMKLVGLDSLQEALQITVPDCFFPEDRAFVTQQFLPGVVRQGHGEIEIRFRHFKTGAALWMNYKVFTLRDAAGKVIGWATVSANIDERKRAEAALRESETRLRLAQKAAHIATSEWNVRAGTNCWTPELEAMYGVKPGEFPQTQEAWENLIHPADRATAVRCVRQAFETGVGTEGEWRCVWPDGSTHWISARFQLFKDSERVPLYLLGIHIDVTRVKLAEERFRKVVEASPIGKLILDSSGNILLANPQVLNIFGYSEAELLGRSVTLVVPELDWPVSLGTHLQTNDFLPKTQEHFGLRKDDVALPIEIALNAIDSEGGKLILITIIDITHRRRAEEKLNSTLVDLKALTGHLVSVREQERTRIARELHDELGQSLTGLKLELAWMKNRLAKDGHGEFLALAREKADGMSQLIDTTIHSMRRIVTELRPAVLDEFGLAAALEWLGQECQKRTGARCLVTVNDDGLNAEQCSALFRIAQEALTNVARHALATEIVIDLLPSAAGSTLKIRDNGKGMSITENISRRSYGIVGMRERAIGIHGTFTLKSYPGAGTQIVVTTPWSS